MISPVVQFPLLRPFVHFFVGQQTGLAAADVRPVDDVARLGPRPVLIIQDRADTLTPSDSAGLGQAQFLPRITILLDVVSPAC